AMRPRGMYSRAIVSYVRLPDTHAARTLMSGLMGATALGLLLAAPVAGHAEEGAHATSTAAPRAFAPPDMPPSGDQTWHLDMIGASVAYGRGFTGQDVTVAVGDTGFDITHPQLADKLDLTRAKNYI